MRGYDPATWGDSLADVYEEWLASRPWTVERDSAVDLLEQFAAGGRVLELAVGTGRIAIPLAERGLEVHGVDASEAMITKLRARPGGDRVEATLGDFGDVPVEGPFRVIFVAFNTFPALLSQEEQVRCFHNVAERLTHDGVFVLEIAASQPSDYTRDNSIYLWNVEPDRVMLTFERHDVASQTTEQVEVWLSEQKTQMFPSVDRYAWLSELDLMARLAGLELRERWAGWKREPFTVESPIGVLVYGRAGTS